MQFLYVFLQFETCPYLGGDRNFWKSRDEKNYFKNGGGMILDRVYCLSQLTP